MNEANRLYCWFFYCFEIIGMDMKRMYNKSDRYRNEEYI